MTAEASSTGGVGPAETGDDAEPTDVVLAQASRGADRSVPWLVSNGRALPLREWVDDWRSAGIGSVSVLVEHWREHEPQLRALTSLPETRDRIGSRGEPIGSLHLEAPIRPRQTMCTIGNYRRQVVEAAVDAGDEGTAADRRAAALELLAQRSGTGEPYVCLTSSDRICAPIGTLPIPPEVDTLDWEVEIAVVVGATARRISPADAAGVIAGYCLANDLTIRSRVTRPDLPALGSDWIQSKGLPGSLPLGPWFVPVWQVPDPSRLRLRLLVNGTVMQDDTADDMLFSIERQLAYVSQHTWLRPGDVLCTGSPAGFGTHHGRFLRPGDVVQAWVSGLGVQRQRCVEERPWAWTDRFRTAQTRQTQ
jgi:2-keto-4-pentenoate hydratase/2-oxohepta-3-ene-1,7-dioic acid hydratase in catechol pathway